MARQLDQGLPGRGLEIFAHRDPKDTPRPARRSFPAGRRTARNQPTASRPRLPFEQRPLAFDAPTIPRQPAVTTNLARLLKSYISAPFGDYGHPKSNRVRTPPQPGSRLRIRRLPAPTGHLGPACRHWRVLPLCMDTPLRSKFCTAHTGISHIGHIPRQHRTYVICGRF